MPTPRADLEAEFVIGPSFAGVAERQGSPPDPSLAVGPDRIVVTTNSDVALFTKEGRLMSSTPLTALFKGLAQTPRVVDPRSLFDPSSGRFFIVASDTPEPAGCSVGSCLSLMLLAVSKATSPTDFSPEHWHRYAFDGTAENGRPTASWGDFSMLSASAEALLVTQRMDKAIQPPQNLYLKIRIFDKAALLTGAPTRPLRDYIDLRDPVTRLPILSGVPAVELSDAAQFYVVAWGLGSGGASCGLSVWGIPRLGVGDAVGRTVPGTASGCKSVPDAEQKGGPMLQANHGALSSPAVYRDGFLWATRTVAGLAGAAPRLRMVKVDVRSWPETPTIAGQWDLAEPESLLFYSALSVTARGAVVIVFLRASAAEFPSIQVTGALAGDLRGNLRPARTVKASDTALMAGGRAGPVRYGDFSGAATDPVDDSVWVIGEYANTATKWGTWIARVRVVSTP